MLPEMFVELEFSLVLVLLTFEKSWDHEILSELKYHKKGGWHTLGEALVVDLHESYNYHEHIFKHNFRDFLCQICFTDFLNHLKVQFTS